MPPKLTVKKTKKIGVNKVLASAYESNDRFEKKRAEYKKKSMGSGLPVSQAHLRTLETKFYDYYDSVDKKDLGFPSNRLKFPITLESLKEGLPRNQNGWQSFNTFEQYNSLMDMFQRETVGKTDVRDQVTDLIAPQTECLTVMNKDGVERFLSVARRTTIIKNICTYRPEPGTQQEVADFNIRRNPPHPTIAGKLYQTKNGGGNISLVYNYKTDTYNRRLYGGTCWLCGNPVWCYFNCPDGKKTSCGECEHKGAIWASFISCMLAAQSIKFVAYANSHVHCNQTKTSIVGLRMNDNYQWTTNDEDIKYLTDEIMRPRKSPTTLYATEYDSTLRRAIDETGETVITSNIKRDYEAWCAEANSKLRGKTANENLDRFLFQIIDSILVKYSVKWLGKWIELEYKAQLDAEEKDKERAANNGKPKSNKGKVYKSAKKVIATVRKVLPKKTTKRGGAELTETENTNDAQLQKEFYLELLLDSCFFIENIIDAEESEEDLNTEAITKGTIETDIDELLNAIENGKAPVETPLDAAIEEEIEEEEDQELNNLAEKIITDLEGDACDEIGIYYIEKDEQITRGSEPEKAYETVFGQSMMVRGGSRKTLKKRRTKRTNKKSNKKNTKRRNHKH
jgi:hypothetical protein